jgi:hypothetical protein
LRSLIYEYACVGSVITVADAANIASLKPGISYTVKHQAASALLHTCRQIRREAFSLFYYHAIFKFKKLGGRDVNKRLGADVCDNIRSIELNEDIAGCLSVNWKHEQEWKITWPNQLRNVTENEFAANLPRLEYVHVEISPKPRVPYSVYIEGYMQQAVRELYGRGDLIVVVRRLVDEKVGK